MKKIILIVFTFYLSICYSQTDSLALQVKIEAEDLFTTYTSTYAPISTPCPYTIKNAHNDIQKDSIKIVIQGSFVGFGKMDSMKTVNFQKKYNVTFEYLGCLRGWDTQNEDVYGYNNIIFSHLKHIYGENVITEYNDVWIKTE